MVTFDPAVSAATTLVVSVTFAPASMPSNFVPSEATSRPSTVPVTVILPVTSIPALKSTLPVNVPVVPDTALENVPVVPDTALENAPVVPDTAPENVPVVPDTAPADANAPTLKESKASTKAAPDPAPSLYTALVLPAAIVTLAPDP